MVVYEKIYCEVYTNDPYIWHKNNIEQLYFILARAKLCWNFSSWLRDVSDIHWFPTLHMVNTHFLLENLWISKPSLSVELLDMFQMKQTQMYICTLEEFILDDLHYLMYKLELRYWMENTLAYIQLQERKRNVRIALRWQLTGMEL